MTFTIIGTGNIAWLLAHTLTQAGHTCIGIYGRNPEAAKTLADIVNAPVIDSTEDIPGNTDCCIIAVSDHAVAEIAQLLSFTHTTLLHTAGSLDINVLASSAKHYGVVWPVYSITKNQLPAHRNIPVIIEASTPEAENTTRQAAESFSDTLYTLNSEQRKWLHLSAVLSNNFTNHLFSISEKICSEHDIPFALLLPIITQTVARLHSGSAHDLQTGPAKRGDNIILEKHLQMLETHPQWQELYRIMSQSIAKMYNKESE